MESLEILDMEILNEGAYLKLHRDPSYDLYIYSSGKPHGSFQKSGALITILILTPAEWTPNLQKQPCGSCKDQL